MFIVSPMLFQAQSPTLDWAVNVGGIDDDNGNSVASDVNGNVYTTGNFQGTVDFDPGPAVVNLSSKGATDYYVMKQDPNGNLLWVKIFGGIGDDQSIALRIDGDSNIIITGWFEDSVDFDPGVNINVVKSNGGKDIFLQKFNTNGNLIWIYGVGGIDDDLGIRLDLDSDNNIYATGMFRDSVDFDNSINVNYSVSNGDVDAFLVKLDSAGNHQWHHQTGGQFTDFGYSIDVAYDNKVNVLTMYKGTVDFDPGTGIQNMTSNGGYDIGIQQFDGNGNLNWVVSFGGSIDEGGNCIETDNQGGIYITGWYNGTVDFDPGSGVQSVSSHSSSWDLYLLKLDSLGDFLWVNSIGDSDNEQGIRLATDQYDNIYLCGYYEGTVDFDPGSGTTNLTANGKHDAFVQKLDANGNMKWVQSYGAAGFDKAYSVYVSNNGIINVAGFFENTVDFDPGTGTTNLTSNGKSDAFILKFNAPVGIEDVNMSETQLLLYPNPASRIITIELPNNNKSQIDVYNLSGELVFRSENNGANINIDVSGFSNGIYLYRWISVNNSASGKFVVNH